MQHELYPSCSLDARRQARAGLDNVYLPEQAVVRNIIWENDFVKTYELSFVDELTNHRFSFLPGQFMMISVPHHGEAPISFSSSPDNKEYFSLTIRNSGRLTAAVHELQIDDIIGVRGPYGKPFPLEQFKNKNLFFIAGGIGMAPLKSVLDYCLNHTGDYGRLTLLYGSKTPEDICFSRELARWRQKGIDCCLTVDEGAEDWKGKIGLVTGLLEEISIGEKDVALVCGPGIMIRFVLQKLLTNGMKGENMFTTLERHMKCGVGICGHCHMEEKLVCLDGPVFSAAELPDPENP